MLLLALALAVTLVASANADLMLGSTLVDEQEGSVFGGQKSTVYQVTSVGSAAPTDGTISSWSVRSGDMNAEYELRVIRAGGGGKFTAVGTSAPQKVTDANDTVKGPFPVSLPVKAGDRIALDVISGSGAPIHVGALAGQLNYLSDPFAENATEAPVLVPPLGTNQELLLQANFKPGPVNTVRPTISGEARAGTPLAASEGAWEDASAFAFQWRRCAAAVCSAIAGATSSSYTPVSADEGQQLGVDVTATSEGGKATASSDLTDGVKPGPAGAPTSTGPPLLSGEARETEALSGTEGNWAGSPTRFQYQWLRCSTAAGANCAAIPGATATSYLLRARRLRVDHAPARDR
jgi:hypothetical protein